MNWYRKGQVIVDPESAEYLAPGEIGHDLYLGSKPKHKEFVWLWNHGHLDVVPAKKGEAHQEIWGGEGSKTYRGRYDDAGGQKKVSIVIPFKLRSQPIPDKLIAALARRWGQDIRIFPNRW